MPYNPISGQFEYGGQTYNAPTTNVGMAMGGMEAVGANVPLAFRMMENIPSISAGAMFNARRFANTMFEGGYLDVAAGTTGRRLRRARKYGAFVGDDLQPVTKKGFLFGRFRNEAKLAEKTPFLKPSLKANFPRLRNARRLPSLSATVGLPNEGSYTLFQSSGLLNPFFEKTGLRKSLAARGLADENRPLFSGGVLGRMSTMTRAYSMESTLAKLDARAIAKGGVQAEGRTARRIRRKLGGPGMDEGLYANLKRTSIRPLAAEIRQEALSTIGAAGSIDDIIASGLPEQRFIASMVGKGNLRAISDSARGVVTRNVLEYYGTALNPGQFVGTRAYTALEGNIAKTLMGSAAGPVSPALAQKVTQFLAGETVDDIGKYGVRSLTKLATTAFGQGERKVAAKLAGLAGTRALGLAMPALNVIGTASLVYDLTKMAGQAFISAGNFAKDAVKSMQGSLHKPLFGMGYQDNEVAATSRARGVMAIQNSRLNARSLLGSEASMMAAHFG